MSRHQAGMSWTAPGSVAVRRNRAPGGSALSRRNSTITSSPQPRSPASHASSGWIGSAMRHLALAAAPRARAPGWLWAGAVLIAFGALLNAAGCFGPAVAVRFLPPGEAGHAAGLALLALTLHLDAHFNLVLGLGLLAVNLSAGPGPGWPAWLRALGVVAGLASLPVALQFWSDPFAKLLSVSGPLWLAWFTAVALRGGVAPPAVVRAAGHPSSHA